jgi:hypothetical protein
VSIINIFAPADNLTLKRVTGPSDIVDGIYQNAARGSVTFTGSVQPITGRELLDLPEAQRTREPKMVITETELKTLDKTAGTAADIVEYEGEDYEVTKVEALAEWDGAGLAHYEVTMLKKDE